MHDIYPYLESQAKEMQHYLREIVIRESPSHDKASIDQLGEWIKYIFREITGGSAVTLEEDVYGNHIRGEWGEGDKQILILGHLDTVWPLGTLERMPFQIEGDIAKGPGVYDMKGGIIQGLFALKALKDLEKKLNKKVVFLFDSDEEIGNPASRKIIEEEAAKSEVVFVLEPGLGKDGSLKTSRKGIGLFEVEVQGIPAHAGIEPEKGVSAIRELSQQIIHLENMSDLENGTIYNVGKISGGTASNVIAEKAYAEIEVRATTTKNLKEAVQNVLKLQPMVQGTELTIKGDTNRQPLERTEDVVKLFEHAQHIAATYLNLDLTESETGGGSDGNLTAPYAPTLDGLGAVGAGAHANHEHLLLKEMPKRSALLALLLLHYGL